MARLVLGAFAGVILGFVAAIVVASVYYFVARAIGLHDTLADLQEAEFLIFISVFAFSAVCITAVSTFAGHLEVRSPVKETIVSVIAGAIFAFAVAWISSFVQMTRGGKFPAELFYVILIVAAPISSAVFGLVGYVIAYQSNLGRQQ